ncbi:MAG TPA: hypothetical protein VHO06_13350 [Polyangia bacterium]|nr:hypothetical protein [Polyangia bacterium]
MKADADESPNAAPPSVSAQTDGADLGAPALSGSVPDVVTPEGQGRETGEEMAAKDAPELRPSGPGNVVVNISVASPPSIPKARASGHGKPDPVISGVSVGPLSQPGGRHVSPFGEEFYEPAFTGIAFAFSAGKCTITARLDPICPWGTNGGGDIDVPSANAAVVTAATWRPIKDDLTPAAASPHKSPRTHYFSQALVDRHEKFHGVDDLGWTRSSGLGIVKAWLEARSVAPTTAATDVTTLLHGARGKLIAENFIWYKGGGTSHDSYAGEIRAYADGRTAYQALADAVQVHGIALQAASGQAAGQSAAESQAAVSAREHERSRALGQAAGQSAAESQAAVSAAEAAKRKQPKDMEP